MTVVLEDRRVRLPPLAKLQVEEATRLLDRALDAGRQAMSQLTTNPAGAVSLAAQQQDLLWQAVRKLEKACAGVPGVEEKRTASVSPPAVQLRTQERT